MAAWMEISSSSRVNTLSLSPLKLMLTECHLSSLSPSIHLLHALFVNGIASFVSLLILFSFPSSRKRESKPFSVSECLHIYVCVCVCVCVRVRVCVWERERTTLRVREIINEDDAWPLFEIWNRSRMSNITAIEQQLGVNWIEVMAFLCSCSAECLSRVPSPSSPFSPSHHLFLSMTLVFLYFRYP